jgi:hypothetical protein
VLGGRHPDHERTRRETLAAAEQRRRSMEQEVATDSRRKRRRFIARVASVVVLGVVGVVMWRLAARTLVLREALGNEEAPFVAQGLQEIASNEVSARRVLEADAPGSSCFVAITTRGTVTARSAGSTFSGAHSVGWCGCAPGHVTVEAAGASDSPAGLALLRIDGNLTGGPLARAWVKVQPGTWGEGGAECADAMLDAWIADHRWPKPSTAVPDLRSSPGGAQLSADGFHLTTSVTDGTAFAVVESVAGDCDLAIAPGRELSLRTTGGARPIVHAHGAMIWCGPLPETFSVWATAGSGQAVILSAPASRLGGLLGAREAAHDAGFAVNDDASWLRVEDQSWDATAILRASGIADVTAGPVPEEPGRLDVRVAAIVAAPSAAVTWEPSLAAVACDPPLESGGATRESVCVPTIASTLWRKGEAPGSAARGALPLWMSTLAQHHEHEVAVLLPDLLALARRLTREGFEPTTFEGVTELRDGVRIVGRAGEDAVVAVGLVPSAPWVLPYSDRVPWDLGDAPRVIALQPGAAVILTSPVRTSAPLDKRRTVVFRRSARP